MPQAQEVASALLDPTVDQPILIPAETIAEAQPLTPVAEEADETNGESLLSEVSPNCSLLNLEPTAVPQRKVDTPTGTGLSAFDSASAEPRGEPAQSINLRNKPDKEVWKTQFIASILSRSGLSEPDGRPLYSYSCLDDDFAALKEALRRRVSLGEPLQSTGTMFVFWAADYIRANFPRDRERQLSWSSVFDGLGLVENEALARQLVQSLGLTGGVARSGRPKTATACFFTA